MKFLYIFLVLYSILIVHVSCAGICSPIEGIETKCVLYKECGFVLKAINNRELSINFITEALKKISCGYKGLDQLVCCSDEIDVGFIQGGPAKKNSSTIQMPTTQKITNEVDNDVPNNELPTSYCGHSGTSDRVYGGNETEIGEFPWMALIGYDIESSGTITFQCGGSLINNKYVLTAAHCMKGSILQKYGEPVKIRLGEHDLSKPIDCYENNDCAQPHKDVDVEVIISHPQYSDKQKYNDIGLLRMSETVHFTYFIRPICLQTSAINLHAGTTLVAAGWGYTEKNRKSDIKLKVKLPYIEYTVCADLIRSQLLKEVDKKQLCAGGQFLKDSCQGDSGGPLMNHDDISQKWIQVGIISQGYHCGVDGTPAIYTSVYDYLDWIKSNLKP